MISRISKLMGIFFLLTLLVIPTMVQAKVKSMEEPNPYYPGTSIEMQVGDVLYSSKTLGSSSQIVGHVGIVGPDFFIYHVTPTEGGGTKDTIQNYMTRHGKGETIAIYKYRYASGYYAANWAKQNYQRATQYFITPDRLSSITPNYCSKFVWQAFYYGEGQDAMGKNLTGDSYTIVYPGGFTFSSRFINKGSFIS
ncbi:hypothetical protein [Paenibacillus tyrfis]|uniref:hypothetical protein n=1 Tax=Paenibacillus tyrfis TaxID=1501230 RepID=UPI000B58D5DA|nr:hypothetical protein [Paenibacillus tyrfis]